MISVPTWLSLTVQLLQVMLGSVTEGPLTPLPVLENMFASKISLVITETLGKLSESLTQPGLWGPHGLPI